MAQPQRTDFLSLPAELRNRIYKYDLRGRTERRNERGSVRLEEPNLLRVSHQIRAEALKMYLAEVKVVVIHNIMAVDGYDSTVAAALVPLLVELELAGFNLRATRDHQQVANQVAAALGRGEEWSFVHRSVE